MNNQIGYKSSDVIVVDLNVTNDVTETTDKQNENKFTSHSIVSVMKQFGDIATNTVFYPVQCFVRNVICECMNFTYMFPYRHE